MIGAHCTRSTSSSSFVMTHQDDRALLDVRHRVLRVRGEPRHRVAAAQRVHAVQRHDAPVPSPNRRAALSQRGAVKHVLCGVRACEYLTVKHGAAALYNAWMAPGRDGLQNTDYDVWQILACRHNKQLACFIGSHALQAPIMIKATV